MRNLPWRIRVGSEEGHAGRHGGRGGDYRYGSGYDEKDRKLKFYTRDGCEVERKWKKGEYEEKVKFKPGRYGYRD